MIVVDMAKKTSRVLDVPAPVRGFVGTQIAPHIILSDGHVIPLNLRSQKQTMEAIKLPNTLLARNIELKRHGKYLLVTDAHGKRLKIHLPLNCGHNMGPGSLLSR